MPIGCYRGLGGAELSFGGGIDPAIALFYVTLE